MSKIISEIFSVGHDNSELFLEWHDDHDTNESLFSEKFLKLMPKFQTEKLSTKTRTVYYAKLHAYRQELVVELVFKRHCMSSLLQFYLPAIVMVISGGFSIMIHPRYAGGKIGLGITTMLTLITLIKVVNDKISAISYLTAIDIYLWTCFLFTFLSQAEFVIVHFYFSVRLYKNNFRNLTKFFF